MVTFLLIYTIIALVVANVTALIQALNDGAIKDAAVVRSACLWPILAGASVAMAVLLVFGLISAGVELACRAIRARFVRA